jgi:hypothetical protein
VRSPRGLNITDAGGSLDRVRGPPPACFPFLARKETPLEFINRYSPTPIKFYLDKDLEEEKLYLKGPVASLGWQRALYPDPALPKKKVWLRRKPTLLDLPAPRDGVFILAQPDVAMVAAQRFLRADVLTPLWPLGRELHDQDGYLVVQQCDCDFDPNWRIDLALSACTLKLLRTLVAAEKALRSYQYGNGSAALAASMADHAAGVIAQATSVVPFLANGEANHEQLA